MSELATSPAIGDENPVSSASAPAEPRPKQLSQWGEIRHRFVQNKLAVVGLFIIAALFLTAAFGEMLAPFDPAAQDLENTLASPNGTHWMGTDALGRDMFSRLIAGTRVAMFVGLASIFFAVLIGVALGAIAGYFAGFADTLVMRIADVFLAFPLMIGAVVIILVTGRGITPVIISLAIFSWATVSRLLRSSILSVREMDYVHAAKALGASGWRIVRTHILPNSMTAVLVYATFNVGTTIVGVAALSFLGAGVPVDVPEWGNMLAAGQGFIGVNDYLWVFPSLFVVVTVLGFAFVGDGLRDALDPKLR
ncbi:ABC transporter permease [Streptomyces avidinii]|uniref:Peptide/nickel transport system permease protein n=1 Tax=Streptomyces avidinii TaxID=1895 RepID=A0ABS4LD96_STRAV|nr:ABC transporter permease [Streptomyces avidinii]MBP2040090.1 peptide/nickel transport system permease protein [Streptomyces avidinii]GGZ18214.1 diguanylate cyclase [Streptomyces avidinii]